jgi:hypothetical protein
MLLLRPPKSPDRNPQPSPVVIILSSVGKQVVVKTRSEEIARLLKSGFSVCVPDLTGIGETGGGTDRGASSAATSRAATALMLGKPMLGQRLGDLLRVVKYLEGRSEIDPRRIGLWGDSHAGSLPEGAPFQFPRRIEQRPEELDSTGALLALLGGLFLDNVHAIYATGSPSSFREALDSPFVQLPADTVVPNLFAAGDLDHMAAVIESRIQLGGVVDPLGRSLSEEDLAQVWPLTRAVARAPSRGFQVQQGANSADLAAWFSQD